MTGEQLVVLALLLAAFAAGWVARDPPRREREEPEVDPGDAAPSVSAVGAAVARAIEAWIDGATPDAPLADLEAAVADLRRHPGPAWADALAAADEALVVFEDFRAGRPLDAAASRALEPLEDRLAAAGT